MTTVYLVRHVETKDVQGLFWASNLDMLWDYMDSIGDPVDFEFADLGAHGAIADTSTPVGEGT